MEDLSPGPFGDQVMRSISCCFESIALVLPVGMAVGGGPGPWKGPAGYATKQ